MTASPWIAVLILLVACCWRDWHERRIPNAWVVAGLLVGLALQTSLPAGAGLFDAADPGAIGPWRALGAVALMLAPCLVLWRLRFFGAGDAKLLAALAAYGGPSGVLPLLLATLVAGGLLALWAIAWRRWLVLIPSFARVSAGHEHIRLPYSLAVSGGGLAWMLAHRAGWLPG